MTLCQLCKSEKFANRLNFGPQPVSHRFSNDTHIDNYRHPIEMGQCEKCGLVQILKPFPIDELVPRFNWLTCTEPEGHLDRLVQTISKLPGIDKESKIIGLTFKEDTTLMRFNQIGFHNTYRFDMHADFGASNPLANIETATSCFDLNFAKKYTDKNGKCDIFICRHVIEHSTNISHFIEAIKELTHKNSYIIIEIPECGSAFDLCDYTTVWEEHNLYFTPQLFKSFLRNSGFSIHSYIQEPYPLEDACIAIAQKSNAAPVVNFEESNYTQFVSCFPDKKNEIRNKLISLRKSGKIALFGAGHMSVAFVNLLGIEDLIDFVIDDNQNKLQYYLPGTHLQIKSSTSLYSDKVGHCLMSLAPESEIKVTAKHADFIKNGGKFLSIFNKNPSYFLRN